MENKIILTQEQIEGLKALVNHLDKQIQEDREARAKLDQQKRDERIHKINVELADLSKELFEKETEFKLLQFKRDDLLTERKELFAENAKANGWKF